MACTFNPALQTSAKLVFTAFPEVEFATQAFRFPEIRAVYPTRAGPTQWMPEVPSGLEYGDLIVNFLIDSSMDNYSSIVEWIQASITMERSRVTSDVTVMFLDSTKQITKRAVFADVFPIHITEIDYAVAITDPEPLIATATFKYTNYKFE